MILCDTNIFIEIYRRNIGIRTEIDKIGHGNIAVSDVTRIFLPGIKLYQFRPDNNS